MAYESSIKQMHKAWNPDTGNMVSMMHEIRDSGGFYEICVFNVDPWRWRTLEMERFLDLKVAKEFFVISCRLYGVNPEHKFTPGEEKVMRTFGNIVGTA